MSLRHRFFYQLINTPPRLLWRKVRRRLKRQVQITWARLETRLGRAGVSDQVFRRSVTVPDFLTHMHTRRPPRFFIDPAARAGTVAALRAACPQSELLTIAAADRVCEHIFDLLGSSPVHLGTSIDWHADFKTGHRWDPAAFYLDITYAPFPGGYDIKVPWELSRCQHFVWLGQAYRFTGAEKYAREFVSQTLDWIENNPPRLGVNWVTTMDVAIRAVNWLWGYYFFKDSPSLSDEFCLAFFKSLLVHGRHIFTNLEYSETLTNNHYLANIVGLVYLGILLPEFKEARRWRAFGLQELEKEMFKQVYPDGANFEASTCYHRLATEMFLSAALLAQRNDHTFSRAFMARLEKMVEFAAGITKPDGTVPLIGDNDNGRLHRLKVWAEPDREWVDHRYLAAIGAVLFNREDFAAAAGNQWEDAIWLLGEKARKMMKGERGTMNQTAVVALSAKSCAFPDAGLYVLRAGDFYMIVDAGGNGQNGRGGHAHNDVFSFELYANGQTWLVDPGTYGYTADYAARNRFRSTAYHNTVMVDEQEQNHFDARVLFKMNNGAHPRVLTWQTESGYMLFAGEHRGYVRLPVSVKHRRQFYLDKTDRFCFARDSLFSNGEHRYVWHFHLNAASVECVNNGQGFVQMCGGGGLLVTSCSGDAAPLAGQIKEGWFAPGYGSRQQIHVIEYSATMRGDFVIDWIFYPFSANGPPAMEQISRLREKAQAIIKTSVVR